jgi:hypothetical protein
MKRLKEVPETHPHGNVKMPMALQTHHNGKVKISEASTWRMVSNTTTDAGRPQQTNALPT